jgi:hypothetical protein
MRYLTHGTIRPRREAEKDRSRLPALPRKPLEGFKPVLSRKNAMRYKDHAYNKSAKGRPKNRAESVVCGSRWNYFLCSGKSTPFFRAPERPLVPPLADGKLTSIAFKREENLAPQLLICDNDMAHLTWKIIAGRRQERDSQSAQACDHHEPVESRAPALFASYSFHAEARQAEALHEESRAPPTAPVIPISWHEDFRPLRLLRHDEERCGEAHVIELRPAAVGAPEATAGRASAGMRMEHPESRVEAREHIAGSRMRAALELPLLDFNGVHAAGHEMQPCEPLGSRPSLMQTHILHAAAANDFSREPPPSRVQERPAPGLVLEARMPAGEAHSMAPPAAHEAALPAKKTGYISSPQKKTAQLKVARADATPPQ